MGEGQEKEVTRTPCTCTQSDYECDVNFIKNNAGGCDPIKDHETRFAEHYQTEKEADCAAEGFYYVTQGYRKISGNSCTYGTNLNPTKKPCSSMAWFSSLFNLKTILLTAAIGFGAFYGWPIIEALIIISPIPDPKDVIEKFQAFIGMFFGLFGGLLGN